MPNHSQSLRPLLRCAYSYEISAKIARRFSVLREDCYKLALEKELRRPIGLDFAANDCENSGMSKEERKQRVKKFTAQKVRELAVSIESLNTRAQSLQAKLQSVEGELAVDGGEKAIEGLKYLVKVIADLDKAYELSLVPTLDPEPDETPEQPPPRRQRRAG